MNTLERIDQDYINSVKAREAFEVSVLRMLRSSLKNAAIEKKSDLNEDDTVDVVTKEAKQVKDSLESFKEGGREDLIEKATKELEILQKYLPEQMGEDKLRELVRMKIADMGEEVTAADFGRVMSEVMKDAKGKAEGSLVSKLVKEELSH